ncbi:hypothetical protein FW774_01725 (plasmid) [Pedobacter sp. BS3]|uniref:hypothetical protein n=1 Tax=Pedobacter sp. BS3 TaxID=2567937 RepID=UPI0011EF3B4A|nr:hypothetical protein [Pedobacter sp. BS3]TZF85816.1 hypothetical protein FW774_01725 [Pedobacter sp. BS3]
MKNLLLITVFTIYGQITSAQSTKYLLPNIGFITVSDKMEIQGGSYKAEVNDYLVANGVSTSNRYVFQQKGINSGNGYDTYARIIIKKNDEAPSIYLYKLKSNGIYTKSELNSLNTRLKKEIQDAISAYVNASITYWKGVEQVKINGQNALQCVYKRKSAMSPSVTCVKRLLLVRGNSLYLVNLEYWEKDASLWKSILDNSIASFKIKA